VERQIRTFLSATRPDELMITGHFHDIEARLRSLEMVADIRDHLAAADESVPRG
jgi:predicted phosphohydrolase